MTTAAEWADLAERCEQATDASADVSEAISRAAGVEYANLTSSLDAIIALIEQALPGFSWKVGTCSVSDDAWIVPDYNCPIHGARLRAEFGEPVRGEWTDAGVDIDRRPSGSPALALCEAFCLTMAAIEDAREKK